MPYCVNPAQLEFGFSLVENGRQVHFPMLRKSGACALPREGASRSSASRGLLGLHSGKQNQDPSLALPFDFAQGRLFASSGRAPLRMTMGFKSSARLKPCPSPTDSGADHRATPK